MSFFNIGGRGIIVDPDVGIPRLVDLSGGGGGGFPPPSDGRLWLNLSFPYDWGRDTPTIDVMRYAREWRAQVGGTFNDPAVLAAMMATADADGYPTSIPGGAACATIILNEQGTAAAPILAGRYRVDWLGTGTVQVVGGTGQTSGANWVEFDFSPTASNMIDVRITATDAVDNVRRLRCYRTSHASLLAAGNVVHPAFKDVWGGVKLLRFMDSFLTNTNPASNWSQAATATSIGRGLSLHDAVAICNELGCDMWVCMPYASTSDYVTQAATVVRDTLNPALKVYVEYANEWWNWAGGFQTAPYLEALRTGKPYNWAQQAGGRSTETMIAWSAVFSGQMSRTVRVGGMHTTWHELNDDFINATGWVAEVPGRVAPHTVHDAFAITAYFNCPNDEWEEVIDAAEADYATGMALLGSKADADVQNIITNHYPYFRSLCTGLGKKLLMYEGGTHIFNPGGLSNMTLANAMIADINEGATMYARYADLMVAWDAVGDGGFNCYVSVTRPNPTATTFGLQHHLLDFAQSRYQAARDYNFDELNTGGGEGTPVGGKTVNGYGYYNSLYCHANGAGNNNPDTRVANQVKRMALQAPNGGNAFTMGGTFGFFWQWPDPPEARDDFAEVSSPYAIPWTQTWAGKSNITHVMMVPDNFDGQGYDPAEPTGMGYAYESVLLARIDAWVANAPNPSRVFYIYSGLPAMNIYGGSSDDPSTIPPGPPSGYSAWTTYGLGAYNSWMELLVSRLQAARPGLNIRLHPVSRVMQVLMRDTVVSTIPKGVLFEDMAPHGRGSCYFLLAVVEYMCLFNEKPPVGLVFDVGSDWGVDSVIKDNYQAIVDAIWAELHP